MVSFVDMPTSLLAKPSGLIKGENIQHRLDLRLIVDDALGALEC